MTAGQRNRPVLTALLAVIIPCALALPSADARVSVYPSPGTPVASESTSFSFRDVKPNRLGAVRIVGSESGRHRIRRRIRHSDGRGVSLVPGRRFVNGETVRVFTGEKIEGATRGDFRVRIGRFIGGSKKTASPLKRERNGLESRPDLKPPEITVTRKSNRTSPGSYFVGFKKGGMTILDRRGRVTWLRPATFGYNNFEPQTLNGRPVLTFFRRPTPNREGAYVILNRRYRKIAEVEPGNGYQADMHEFHLTGRGTALMLAYRAVRWNLRRLGGPTDAIVADNVVQEIDLKTGAVLFEWHALGNINLRHSREPRRPNSLWDAIHLNSIEPDGNSFLISARRTSTIYRIDRSSGRTRWVLRGDGGRSDFRVGHRSRFREQHDVRRLPNGDISIFDNASALGRRAASVLVLRLSRTRSGKPRAVRVARYRHPGGRASGATGGAQVLPDGHVLAGWGNTSSFTEFGRHGNVLFHARYRSPTYRVRKVRWHGIPAGRPAIASRPGRGRRATVFASWNGASRIARWEVLTGRRPGRLTGAGGSRWINLETAIPVPRTKGKVRVIAYDRHGKELGRSALVRVGRRSR